MQAKASKFTDWRRLYTATQLVEGVGKSEETEKLLLKYFDLYCRAVYRNDFEFNAQQQAIRNFRNLHEDGADPK